MTTVQPLVSVVVPTYKRARYLPRTLESIARQTYPNIELVICDNASNDGSREIIEGFRNRFAKFTFIEHSENVGPVRNWFSGIEASQGEYIKIVFSDDFLYPDAIADLVKPLAGSSHGLSFGHVHNLWNGMWVTSFRNFTGSPVISARQYVTSLFAPRYVRVALPISPGAALMRRDVISKLPLQEYADCFGFDVVQSGIGPDTAMFLASFVAGGTAVHCGTVVSGFEGNAGSITVTSGLDRLDANNFRAVLKFRTLLPEGHPMAADMDALIALTLQGDPRINRCGPRRDIITACGLKMPVNPPPPALDPLGPAASFLMRVLGAIQIRFSRVLALLGMRPFQAL